VLESGIAASSLSWTRVQPEVARLTRVCAYDRAGLAWSEPASAAPTVARIVDDLHLLVTNLDLSPPFVLVGHSFGAFICMAYAIRYPKETGGMVLIDPPSDWMQLSKRQVRTLQGGVFLSEVGAVLARLGVVRACLALLTGGAPGVPRNFVKVFGPEAAGTLERLVGEVRKLPSHVHPAVQALWCQPKCFRAMALYLGALKDASAAVRPLASVGDIPVSVISSRDQSASVLEAHDVLARISTRGRHIVATNSGHWVQLDEPDLVIDTIRDVVEVARQRRAEPADTISTRRWQRPPRSM
jgi:pimeloyl-ACP methyl ester carboxylesterase